MSNIQVQLEYFKVVNYALFHNRIPVCQFVEVFNPTDEPVNNLKVLCEGPYVRKSESTLLPLLKGQATFRFSDFEIVPDLQQLVSLTERMMTEFTLTVMSGEEKVFEQVFPLELMAYDQWLGTTTLPQTLVSFVTPNHPMIQSLVVKAAAILKGITNQSAFTAYQSGNTNDVRVQVAAIFAALHQSGIIYKEVPASFEVVGQRITMPDQVLATKIGNCIELTLLFASVLESVGINSGIVLQKGHAYLAVWLVNDSCSYSICDDASFIEKKCSRGIDEMMVLETTIVTQEQASFEGAVHSAEQDLAKHDIFEMMLDVRRCRLERFLPLPTRVQTQDGIQVEGVEHDSCEVEIHEHDRYDLSQLRESQRELTKFDIWERKLLDFSLRNSLLNLYLRRKAVQFISFDVDRIEDHLQDGEEYCILSKPDMDFQIDNSERLVRSKLLDGLHELVSNDIEHHRLHTYQTESETLVTLKNIYRAARNAIEETGANSLFLTIGTLRWFETPQSEVPRYAPLLLLPVEMVYKKGSYFIRSREEDITLNITLMEFLRQNYDITVNGLAPLPKDGSGVNVPLIFAALRDALKNQKRWDVEEECLLGTFSFSKFLMWNDVHNNREQLKKNDIVNSLVENRLTWQPEPLTTDLKTIDQTLAPAEVALPVPVDSSQLAAVIEGGKGHSFILYGPPGTGKSQTITNLIANALYQGKRVLFVAEKMAALSVVQSRLAKIGLAPFCLELHSNKASKRHVLEQLDKALKVAHIVPPANYEDTAARLFEERKSLITYMKGLHDVDPSDGLSLYDCILRYESVNAKPLSCEVLNPTLDQLVAKEGMSAVEELLGGRLEAVIKLVGQPSTHPLKGLRLDNDGWKPSPELVSRLKDDVQYLSDCQQRREALNDAKALREQLLRDNDASIFQVDSKELYDAWRKAKAKWFLPRIFAKKNFIKKLQTYNKYIVENEVDGLLENLMAYQQKHTEIEKVRALMMRYFQTAVEEDTMPQEECLTQACQNLHRWIDNAPQMRDWLHWSLYAEELKTKGLASVVAAYENQTFAPAELRDGFMKTFFQQKAMVKMEASPMLSTFEGMIFDERVKIYARLTEEFQMLTQKELYARLAARVPKVSSNIDSSSEIGLLNRNVSNGGRGLSLRDLFDQIPTLLPRLCPCMLMSPMSVAQYLDLTQDKFDLVVFDEASQMPTSEAVGAIARGKSLIVVGDPKQMPPTSFFSSTNVDEDEAAIDDMESILEDCRTLEMPSLQLNWHYRSRHESLIAFSNNEYYDGSLITFPSVDDQSTKVQFVPVKGYYDKGGKRSNRKEAEAIVAEIKRRLSDEKLRQQSIGVIAFSVVQQSLIEDLLLDLLEQNKELHEAADAMYEPIFVKNLENVQGDERDVILFSIGYGPDKEGKVSMNFGPLNNSGGERRLNVAVSRARQEMIVFSTLRAAQVDLRRSKAKGVEGLKHFLEYAETQSLACSSVDAVDAQDTIVAEQIADELKKMGYVADTEIGRSHFKVDVAVAEKSSPNVYKLGILLDGANYRDTQTTRDREIVQPSVLNSLNWQVMRVWSVDWFNNPQRVLDRVVERLHTDKPDEPAPVKQVFDVSNETIEKTATSTKAKPYQEIKLTPAEVAQFSDKALVESILKVEQPISFMQLCRKVCALRELGRITPTLQRALADVVSKSFFLESELQGQTVWLSKEDSLQYPWYRPNSNRDITDVPMIEIKNVVLEAIQEQFAIQMDNLTLIAAKKLGFTRRGANVDAAFKEAVRQLTETGLIVVQDGKLKMKE